MVASRSVVVSDVPPYAIVGGNPAVVIKQRFIPPIVEALLAVAWWNWPIDKGSRNLAAIVAAGLEALRASLRGARETAESRLLAGETRSKLAE
jgi:virginiamycin A acetyltransferase